MEIHDLFPEFRQLRQSLLKTSLFLFAIELTSILLLILTTGKYDIDTFYKIIIGVISGVISSICVTIFIYCKHLKRIPEETKKKLNCLLNNQLNHVTEQHKILMQSVEQKQREIDELNFENSILHQQIQDLQYRRYRDFHSPKL